MLPDLAIDALMDGRARAAAAPTDWAATDGVGRDGAALAGTTRERAILVAATPEAAMPEAAMPGRVTSAGATAASATAAGATAVAGTRATPLEPGVRRELGCECGRVASFGFRPAIRPEPDCRSNAACRSRLG